MRHNFELEKRRFVFIGIILTIVLIYAVRLFYLQVWDEDLKEQAARNAHLIRTKFPARGIIYDRNGKLLVYNQPAYDLVVTMRGVEKIDTLDFCKTVGITREIFDQRMADIKDRHRNPGYSPFTLQTFATQLSGEDYGILQEKLYKFPCFEIRPRTIRQYKYKIAPHVLGNIREVSIKDIENDDYYQQGDYTGDLGVEKSYEKYLRGEKGQEILLRNAHGVVKGHYENGKFDSDPVPGKNLTLTLDADLQAYAESLMNGKVGAVVAIQPQTGEILCMVSSPTFDPTLLVGRQRGKNYRAMMNDPYKPLYDRSISASYPPGSTFKPTQGLIALQEKVITPNTPFACSHGYHVGGFKLGCHGHPSPLPLIPAIATSCNAYFCAAFRAVVDNRKYKSLQESFEVWKQYMISMGYGYKLGVDIPNERRGFIPNTQFYNKAFRTDKWKSLNIVSISIGQGEILATPLQIANLASTIANRGYYYIPHVIKAIQDEATIPDTFLVQHRTLVDRENYNYIVEGMRAAVTGGTCRIANLPGIEVCGKTGTAQNPHGKDHSVFMGFAPKDNPQIAICVYVENAGFGATFGVPIGSLVMERYLIGTIADNRKYLEERMLQSTTLQFINVK
jgi:penicillin-binding protein 2